MNVGHILIGIAVLGVVWIGLRALGLPRFGENPDSIIGTKVQLAEPDGLGSELPQFPLAVVQSFADGSYRVEFVEAFAFDGRPIKGASISARHASYPISRAKRHRFGMRAVNGELDTGDKFIAVIRRA